MKNLTMSYAKCQRVQTNTDFAKTNWNGKIHQVSSGPTGNGGDKVMNPIVA